MRAVICRELGGIEKLTIDDVRPPALRPGTVRIAVAAAGANFADTLLVSGQYQEKPPLPFIPGFEVAGTVIERGAGVARPEIGERVLAFLGQGGGYAEEVVVEADSVHVIPASMDLVTAAGFPVAYGTSHGAFAWRGRLRAGESVLVLGASGGVGLTAVEIAKAMGATVIAAAGGGEKLAVAHRAGADHLIDYRSEDVRERVKAITAGRGVDVVYDPVGGDVFDAALRATAWEGRILVIGFAGGRIPQIPANLVLVKNVDVIGFYWASYRHRAAPLMAQSFAQLFRWFEDGRLRPHVSQRLDLSEIHHALELLKTRRSTGKIVLTVARPG